MVPTAYPQFTVAWKTRHCPKYREIKAFLLFRY